MKNKHRNITYIIQLIIFIILICTVIFIFAGCGKTNKDEQGGDSDKSGEKTTEQYGELQIGDTAPDFSVELLSGETVKLSDYKGKAVFVNFWATWCGPCVEEMPDIQKLSEAFANDLVVLAINYAEKKNQVDEFITKNNYTFNVGLDEKTEISERYPSTGIPYTVIINADGIITSIHLGASSDMFSVYEEDVKAALGMYE